ncbi:MAG: helix-turn-helix transcriptional regulator, partial [Rickettsia endosymbiont of Ixodes persulcatus]|nr:helix-turn-helix transcriptional regulator [Rickettsia endosymbiont of Ixodes persulcatus]
MSTKYNTKNFIEQKLLSLKINKKVLAEQINIKYCSLLQIVNNGVTPNLKTLIKIATYFNCSINDVIAVGPNVNSKIYTSYVDISDALQNYNKNLREF